MNRTHFSILLCVSSILSLIYSRPKSNIINKPEQVINKQSFIPRLFDLQANVISTNQFEQHYQLYVGYINKRNSIKKDLENTSRSEQNPTYSVFRGLKTAETFARNAALLHELYFENLKSGTKIGKTTKLLLKKNFSSLKAFKEDLIACAQCARGWAITCYNLDDDSIQNYLLDAHNQTVPVLSIPLLVIDVYEHAYMIDYGINRAQYLELLWNNINWDIVEERINRWIKNNPYELGS